MLARVCGSVRSSLMDKRRRKTIETEKKDDTIDFEIRSLLLEPRAKKNLEGYNLNPFRAILRCVGPAAEANMELVDDLFPCPHLNVVGAKANGLESTVSMPVARNTCAIKEGEVLTLPFEHDEDNEI